MPVASEPAISYRSGFASLRRGFDSVLDSEADGVIGVYGSSGASTFDDEIAQMRATAAATRATAEHGQGSVRFVLISLALAEELWDDIACAELSDAVRFLEPQSGSESDWLMTQILAARTAQRCGGGLGGKSFARYALETMRSSSSAPRSVNTLEATIRAWDPYDTAEHAAADLRSAVDLAGVGALAELALETLALLELATGNYSGAFEAAQMLATCGVSGRSHALALVAEAGVRCGRTDAAFGACTRLRARAISCSSPWALGVLARTEAETHRGPQAEECYRTALDHLQATRVKAEVARTHLLYGEWLRRQNRRLDARPHLGIAQEIFDEIEAREFSERSRRELHATAERARPRRVETSFEPTPQELAVARLAAAGATNKEIAAQLFLSAHTVDYHLRKVYQKLGVSSRRDLRRPIMSQFSDATR